MRGEGTQGPNTCIPRKLIGALLSFANSLLFPNLKKIFYIETLIYLGVYLLYRKRR
jgi:hypothetical protein